MTIRSELARRWKAAYDAYPAASTAKKFLDSALRILDKTDAARAKVGANANLSDLGKREALRDEAGKFGWLLGRTREGAADFRKAVQAQRDELAPKPRDKTDVAAAILRMDARNFLRSLSTADRLRLIESDQTMFEAAFEGVPQLSGLTADQRDQLLRSHLERTAGPALAAISEQAEAVELIETAAGAASKALATAVGVMPEKLDAWISTQPTPTGLATSTR